MLAKVHLGYDEGVALPSPEYGSPIYGQIVSEFVRGRQMLELWPFDFPMSAKQNTTVEPLRTLWRPQISGFMQTQFGISGLECLPVGKRHRWVAQRWLCEPMSYVEMMRVQEPSKRVGASR